MHGTILVTFTRTGATMKMRLIIMKEPYSTIRRILWRWLTWGIVWLSWAGLRKGLRLFRKGNKLYLMIRII
jgi:hypothetical protein